MNDYRKYNNVESSKSTKFLDEGDWGYALYNGLMKYRIKHTWHHTFERDSVLVQACMVDRLIYRYAPVTELGLVFLSLQQVEQLSVKKSMNQIKSVQDQELTPSETARISTLCFLVRTLVVLMSNWLGLCQRYKFQQNHLEILSSQAHLDELISLEYLIIDHYTISLEAIQALELK